MVSVFPMIKSYNAYISRNEVRARVPVYSSRHCCYDSLYECTWIRHFALKMLFGESRLYTFELNNVYLYFDWVDLNLNSQLNEGVAQSKSSFTFKKCSLHFMTSFNKKHKLADPGGGGTRRPHFFKCFHWRRSRLIVLW